MDLVRIGDLCSYAKGLSIPRDRTSPNKNIAYLHYGDLYKKYDFRLNLSEVWNEIIKIESNERYKPEQILRDGDIVFTLTSESVDDLGHSTLIVNKDNLPIVSGMETTILHIREKDGCLPPYLNYVFQSNWFRQVLRQYVTGMKVYRVHPRDLMEIKIPIPSLYRQHEICSMLDSISDCIDINSKINDYLTQVGETIFSHWVSEISPLKIGSLTDIADFQNVLAMQKYPPSEAGSYPVLKIRELNLGHCDSESDLCSIEIKPEVVIDDEDIVFSWSGSLVLKIWFGGRCGLNQHLFKVTSKDYPKWFYYYWIKHHLSDFIDIAQNKATTMGHINRNHLEEAKVLIPTDIELSEFNKVMSPLFNQYCSVSRQIVVLEELRDTMLNILLNQDK